MPAWLADHQLNVEREEEAFEFLEDDIRDKYLEEHTKPLAMRLFKPAMTDTDPTNVGPVSGGLQEREELNA